MKPFLLSVILLANVLTLSAQITTPVIRAGFGVDAELRANYFNGFVQSGNDDWFNNGTAGTGNFIIDTTGAFSIMQRYVTDPNFRKLPFYRTMRYPAFSVVNNRMLIDAIYTRDYHGDDSTIFAAGSNKNGMSPVDWSCPVSQSIPDKNDILDMMVHVRRAGPSFTDSLWMIGGVSIENTTGNRYFDFEMYQTDIFYDRSVRRFFGYGPDDGHTSWKFDAAGNITQPGDIIFTAEYSSSSLTMVEARIWVDRASLAVTPATFDWSGLFDGANNSAQFGYASIRPKSAGAFYTGLQSVNNTWPGPFGLVLGNNSMPANYTARQFMEFSVNLTKLGLDPVQLLGNNPCGMAFRKVLVKSRASTSFTAELKDFVGPFDFFITPKAQAAADIPLFCGSYGVSNIQVTNPVATSIYEWATTDGNIVSLPQGPSIFVDLPGSYVVTQRIQSGCPAYALDTVVITFDPLCSILDIGVRRFTGNASDGMARLSFMLEDLERVKYVDIERSFNGKQFSRVGHITGEVIRGQNGPIPFDDPIQAYAGRTIFYRLRIIGTEGQSLYSQVISVQDNDPSIAAIRLYPNPASQSVTLQLTSPQSTEVEVRIIDAAGRVTQVKKQAVSKGSNQIRLDKMDNVPEGVYFVRVQCGQALLMDKLVIRRE